MAYAEKHYTCLFKYAVTNKVASLKIKVTFGIMEFGEFHEFCDIVIWRYNFILMITFARLI